MANIACFVERYTVSRAEELAALANFKMAARDLGHNFDYMFRKDIGKIPQYDALFIRSLTNPMNAAYVASRMAELNGLRVIDDPDSIIVCCDKINMYLRQPLHEAAFGGAQGRACKEDCQIDDQEFQIRHVRPEGYG